MNNLIKWLRNLVEMGMPIEPSELSVLTEAADALSYARDRSRLAFIAGANAVMNDQDVDIVQAWQQHRCQSEE